MGRSVADYLRRNEWVRCDFGASPPILTITPQGFDEIDRLKWPSWGRWLHKNTPVAAFFLSALALLVSILIAILR
jgi:hypothetical protein